MATTVEILRAARDLITNPERWAKSALAINGNGVPTEPNAPDACRWCALGALDKIDAGCLAGEWWRTPTVHFLETAAVELYEVPNGEYDDNPAVQVNDQLGHEAVLRVYDAAIAKAEAAQ